MIVDGHTHVFRSARDVPRTVDDLAPANREAPIEDLLSVMAASDVDGAVLVPLGPLESEARYVADCVRSEPQPLAFVAVADAAVQGRVANQDAADVLRRRRTEFRFHGLRTQWLGDPTRDLADSPMLPTFRELAAHGEPLWSYLPREQLRLLRQLAAELPDLPIVLNHLGFCPHDMQIDSYGRPSFADPFPDGCVDAVLQLARHRQVRLMLSGQYALSRQQPPYEDLAETVGRLADAYGSDRIMWASDYPWTRNVPGYPAMLALPQSALPGASTAELADILGGTAARLFPHLRPAGED